MGAPPPIVSTMNAIQNLSETEQQEIEPWIAYMGREANTDLKQKSYYRSLHALFFLSLEKHQVSLMIPAKMKMSVLLVW